LTRKQRTVPVGNETRYLVTITGDPGQKGPDLLQELLQGHCAGLLNCGPILFQQLKMSQDGDSWVITMESTTS
jgi:hypothetical protein